MAATAIGTTEMEGRGRGLVALQPLKAGQIVLRDSPILLYSALPLLPDNNNGDQKNSNHNSYCSHCFRILQPRQPPLCCSNCPSIFCSPNCLSLASATSHTPWVCQALTQLRQYHGLGLEVELQARFLVSAINLSFVSPSSFQTLLSLQGSETDFSDDAAAVCHHSFFSGLGVGFSLEMIAALLAKDKLNSFGLMEPFLEDREERSVRAYGIYPVASFFNHDCLPNACRFDYIDGNAEPSSNNNNNTDMIIRMIHDVPQGREICLSYFPVNLRYPERQKRLTDDYGFVCDCDRCKVEANWSEDEEEEDMEVVDDMDEEEDRDHYEHTEAEAEDIDVVKGEDDFPHAYFFLRYMCERKNCWGTMAPLPPSSSGTSSSIVECNVCGSFKNLDQV